MPEHIKRDGESMTAFRARVFAWNNGSPVEPDMLMISTGLTSCKHDFGWIIKSLYCKRDGCYANRISSQATACPRKFEKLSIDGYVLNDSR